MTTLHSPFSDGFTAPAARDLADTLKALGDPQRLRIVAILHEHGELTVTGVIHRLGDLSQPTTSYHLWLLADAGLITRRKEGVFSYYQLAYGAVQQLAGLLDPGAGLKRGTDE